MWLLISPPSAQSFKGAEMTAWEYDAMQALLTRKAQNNPHSGKRAEGYMDGILAAKSVLHAFYQQQEKEKANGKPRDSCQVRRVQCAPLSGLYRVAHV